MGTEVRWRLKQPTNIKQPSGDRDKGDRNEGGEKVWSVWKIRPYNRLLLLVLPGAFKALFLVCEQCLHQGVLLCALRNDVWTPHRCCRRRMVFLPSPTANQNTTFGLFGQKASKSCIHQGVPRAPLLCRCGHIGQTTDTVHFEYAVVFRKKWMWK